MVIIRTNFLLYIKSKMLSSSRNVLLKLSEMTSPQKNPSSLFSWHEFHFHSFTIYADVIQFSCTSLCCFIAVYKAFEDMDWNFKRIDTIDPDWGRGNNWIGAMKQRVCLTCILLYKSISILPEEPLRE